MRKYRTLLELEDAYSNRYLRKQYRKRYIDKSMVLSYHNFKQIKFAAKKEYKRKMRFVRYWSKIERKFKNMQTSFAPMFVLSFKHDIYSDIVYDDELKIRSIADFYGYNITNEDLSGDSSVYTFERKT